MSRFAAAYALQEMREKQTGLTVQVDFVAEHTLPDGSDVYEVEGDLLADGDVLMSGFRLVVEHRVSCGQAIPLGLTAGVPELSEDEWLELEMHHL